jgi:predicted transcriptional regulator|tara:strand:- start:93 stop:428 length:336 start_codon:yes stop_codon:yes gene_type:complete
MKKRILIGLFCGAVVCAAAIIKKEKVVIERLIVTHPNKEKGIPQISVKVTLTKYQLTKMLDILEEDNNVRTEQGAVAFPAHIEDIYTFTSIAKENKYSGEYAISSTHLSKK